MRDDSMTGSPPGDELIRLACVNRSPGPPAPAPAATGPEVVVAMPAAPADDLLFSSDDDADVHRPADSAGVRPPQVRLGRP